MKDSDLRYVYFNETYGRRFQVDLNHWLGRSDYEVWPEVAEQLRSNDLQVLNSGQPVEVVESIPVPRDGEVRRAWSINSPSPTRLAGGTSEEQPLILQSGCASKSSFSNHKRATGSCTSRFRCPC